MKSLFQIQEKQEKRLLSLTKTNSKIETQTTGENEEVVKNVELFEERLRSAL